MMKTPVFICLAIKPLGAPMETIWLTSDDLNRCRDVAELRQSESERLGCKPAHGASADPLKAYQISYIGAKGELAFCHLIGVRWMETVNTFKAPDWGETVQVRSRTKAWHDLIIRSDDSDDCVYVLMHVDGIKVTFKGWIKGRDGKQEKWSRRHGSRPSAFFVPQSELRRDYVCLR
jgi:hypothetical protein